MSGRPLLDITIPARVEAMSNMRHALAEALTSAKISKAMRDRVVLAVHEACTNIIRHGYGDCAGGQISMTIAIRREQLCIRLRDHAPPVDPRVIRPRDLNECRPGGLGINIIDDTMDRWKFRALKRGAGNVLTMSRRLEKETRS